jgi:hypothetical protein
LMTRRGVVACRSLCSRQPKPRLLRFVRRRRLRRSRRQSVDAKKTREQMPGCEPARGRSVGGQLPPCPI